MNGSLSIGWRYLTGRSVATDVGSREAAEWPPHPGRVYMALAAAWFETEPPVEDGEERARWDAEGEALRWLESLGDPSLVLPPREEVFARDAVVAFVPVNDDMRKETGSTVQSCPGLPRNRQPRTFPGVWVGEAPCFLAWDDLASDDAERHRDALDRLCRKVTRLGHSSSLVEMWLDDTPRGERWSPDTSLGEEHVRPIMRGLLSMLVERYGARPRRRRAELEARIETLDEEFRSVAGPGSRERKRALGAEIERLRAELLSTPARDPVRPTIGTRRGYRRTRPTPSMPQAAVTVFDSDMLVFALDGKRALSAESTLLVCAAMRGAILKGVHDHSCGCDRWTSDEPPTPAERQECYERIPAWVSGHSRSGGPLAEGEEHLAVVCLPFVAAEHADGHLLGVSIVFPRDVSRDERAKALGPLVVDDDGVPRAIRLALGRVGAVEVVLVSPSDPRWTLRPETWTGQIEKGARSWASVSPIVLDRFPKRHQIREPRAWRAEVAGIIARACERVGTPRPVQIEVGTTAWHAGSPRAFPKKRPLRSSQPGAGERLAPLGTGYPFMPAGGGGGPRVQVHARIDFDRPVVGPLLIGAGRYRGYGLCRPLGDSGGSRS